MRALILRRSAKKELAVRSSLLDWFTCRPLERRQDLLESSYGKIRNRDGARCAADSRAIGQSAGNAVSSQAPGAGRDRDIGATFQGLRIRRAFRRVRDWNLAAMASA